MVTMNPNQFEQGLVPGDLDLNIAMTGIISGMVSANQATALAAGSPVKLDAAVTKGRLPQFVAAAVTDKAIGYVKRTLQKSSFVAGDIIEVTMDPKPVMWLVAGGTIAMGAAVETSGSDPTQVITAAGTNQVRGIALDPGTSGQMIRVVLYTRAALTL